MVRLSAPSTRAHRHHSVPDRATRPDRGPASPGDALLPAPPRVAVIDLGSNSGRVIVVEPHPLGYLHIVDEARSPLELTRAIDAQSRLAPEAAERVLAAMAEFVAIARGAGCADIHVVGTAALRRATNAGALMDEIRRRYDVAVEIVDGATEARYAFVGAAYSLPVESGLLIDIGGGSLELVRFDHRELTGTWSFPFGALRLTDDLLAGDPPSQEALAALAVTVSAGLAEAGVAPLVPGEELVGTGGTIRNLAKIDTRRRDYPIGRLHGYVLRGSRLRKISSSLAAMTREKREGVPGLNSARAESIVAGAAALAATMRHAGAHEVVVSGQGLREGVARRATADGLPPPALVRRASLQALTERLSGWDEARAERRAALALDLAAALAPELDATLRELLGHAAALLDVGAAIDFYNRHRETAAIVLRTDLAGFSHRHLATLAAIIQLAERPGFALAGLRPLLAPSDAPPLTRAATVLALADEIVRRCPPTEALDATWRLDGKVLRVNLPWHPEWAPAALSRRVDDALGLRLLVEADDA